MINSVSPKDLERKIAEDHPAWSPAARLEKAEEYLETLDERLEETLRLYVNENKISDFSYGEFTVLMIQALRRKCSYLDALFLMDAYLKDPLNGKAMILRRM